MAKVVWLLRSGDTAFRLTYHGRPHPKLGGARGYYEVVVDALVSPRVQAELLIGAPAALLDAPTAPKALEEIAETAAHFVLSDHPSLPVEQREGRVLLHP